MRSLWAIVFVAFLSSTSAAPVPKHKKQPFFPTTVGAKWVWQEWNRQTRCAVLEVADDGDGKVVTIGQVVEGEMKPVQKWRVSAKEVIESSFDSAPPRQHRVKTPFTAGETWEFDHPNGVDKVIRTAAAEERVKVPAGEFFAIRVDVVRYSNGKLFGKYSEWFAEGIGLVMQKFEDGEERWLKSFENAK